MPFKFSGIGNLNLVNTTLKFDYYKEFFLSAAWTLTNEVTTGNRTMTFKNPSNEFSIKLSSNVGYNADNYHFQMQVGNGSLSGPVPGNIMGAPQLYAANTLQHLIVTDNYVIVHDLGAAPNQSGTLSTITYLGKLRPISPDVQSTTLYFAGGLDFTSFLARGTGWSTLTNNDLWINGNLFYANGVNSVTGKAAIKEIFIQDVSDKNAVGRLKRVYEGAVLSDINNVVTLKNPINGASIGSFLVVAAYSGRYVLIPTSA